MTISTVKFNIKDKPEFIIELRRKVNLYFKENNLSKHGDFNMKAKTAFMLALYLIPLACMIGGIIQSLDLMYFMWVLMGLGMSGIGLAVIHDANHGSYSKKKKINKGLGYLMNIIGAFHITWKIQHNVLHHSFTNIEGFDEDLEIAVMRFSSTQKPHKAYSLQAFYAPFLYGLMTIFKLFVKDFQQLIDFSKRGLLIRQGLTPKEAWSHLILNKIIYLLFTLILPIVIMNISWWHVLLGFLLMQFISGLFLALVFQSAHVVKETEFYEVDENSSVENNWAIHQMNTTSNFARKSVFFSWFIGGLNYQIEHHLFPNICHVHYKKFLIW